MNEPSPTERALASGTLVLHPDGKPDERLVIAPSVVAARPELQIQVLLRDVRDTSQPAEARRAWLDRAWEIAAPMSRFGWYTLHLALVRHAVLVGDKTRARQLAHELVTQMYARPADEVTNQDSLLRDALRRAVAALRVPILAHTIKLDIDDPLPRIIDTAQSDRSLDDSTRLELVVCVLAGVVVLEADAAPVAELMLQTLRSCSARFVRKIGEPTYLLARAANHKPLEARMSELVGEQIAPYRDPATLKRGVAKALREQASWCKGERAKKYLATPIYEWDRIPRELAWRRINNGIL